MGYVFFFWVHIMYRVLIHVLVGKENKMRCKLYVLYVMCTNIIFSKKISSPLDSCMSQKGENAIFFGNILCTASWFMYESTRKGEQKCHRYFFFWVHIIYHTLCPSMGQRWCKKSDFLWFFFNFCFLLLGTYYIPHSLSIYGSETV